jgi:hypothetical protein
LDQVAEEVEMVVGQRKWEVQESVRKYAVCLRRECWYPVSGGEYYPLKFRITLP